MTLLGQETHVDPIGNMIVTVNGVEDNTETSMVQYHTLESSRVVQLPTFFHSYDPARNSSTHPRSSDREVDHANDTKYNEFAKPINQVMKMGDIFLFLADVMEGCGVLDFKYATTTEDHSQHGVQMGTLDFMSVEAIPMEYLFHPAKEPQYPSFDKGGVYEEHPHFHHNALHDIELAWWVGVWMLVVLSYKPKELEDQTKDLSQLCQNETNQIFPGTLAHGTRLLYIMWTTEFLSSTKKWILVELFPAVKWSKRDIYSPLRDVFLDVKRYYTNIMWEKDTLTPMTSQQMQMQSSEK
ncbi:hypothetical protein V8E53_008874 [Lactarius tabidus]